MPTTSNLYQFPDSTVSLLQRAFNLVGIRKTEVTQEHMDDVKIIINLMFSAWANIGVNLWAVDLQIIPMIDGVATYAVDPATIEILDTYISSPAGVSQQDLLLTSASRSEYARYVNKNQPGKPTIYWYDHLAPSQIYPSSILGPLLTISGTGSLATLTYTGTIALSAGAPINIQGCSVAGYNVVSLVTSSSVDAGVVTVTFPSLHTDAATASGSVFLQSMTGPTITLYQVPTAQSYPFLKFYRLRQNQFSDITNGQIAEMPYAWQNAFVDNVAYQLARSWAPPEKEQSLKQVAMESYISAAGRNVEVASLYITPDFGRYMI